MDVRRKSPVDSRASVSLIVVLLAAAALAVSSCGAPSKPYHSPAVEDYSNLSWVQAFGKLNAKFSREYAFTDWKGVNWKALYAKYRARVVRAQKENNPNAYYIALREYAYSIPDGHVSVTGGDPALQKQMIGGGFGLAVTKLDDGTVVASWVKEGGQADEIGIKAGAEILEWDGKVVDKALAATSVIFGMHQATDEGMENERLRFLTRAPVGDTKLVTFRNRGEKKITLTLEAVDDSGESLLRNYPDTIFPPGEVPTSIIVKKILPGNVGYIRIIAEADLPPEYEGDHTPTLDLFRNAVKEFSDAKAAGLIVDVRNNGGGSDQMVTQFMSSFYKEKTFYEYQNYFNFETNSWEIWVLDEKNSTDPNNVKYVDPGQGLYIEPGQPRFDGPVVAITNNECISSGEGVAMGIRNLPNGKVVGFYGTNGSFGMSGDGAKMPGGVTVMWPYGQSLDKDRVIQLDSRDGKGGVSPNVRTPLTLNNAIRVANGQDVELQHALDTMKSTKESK